jgi:uracil-DNA glycosylase family 4
MVAVREALAEVRRKAAACTRCPLANRVRRAPGTCPRDAGRLAAGRRLDKALVEAGIDRSEVYVTNAVKHFKNVPRGKRRIHQRPNAWLDVELNLARPKVVVALGATAARALVGRPVKIEAARGRPIEGNAEGPCQVLEDETA